MKKRAVSGFATIIAFSILLLAGTSLVDVPKANFYMPPAETEWTIQSPQNSTYGTNYITLQFTVETNLGLLYFYSIDGSEKKEINTTTVSKVPLPEYTPFIDGSLWNRRTQQGAAELPYLPRGNHELTIYQIYPRSPQNPQDGNVISKSSISFNITSDMPTQSPTPSATATPQLPNPSTPPSPPTTPSPQPSSTKESSSPTVSPTSTVSPSPSIPEFTHWTAAALGIAALLVTIIGRANKRRHH